MTAALSKADIAKLVKSTADLCAKEGLRFTDSRRTSDSLIYAVDVTVHGKPMHLMIGALRDSDRDSTATLLWIR